MFHIQAEGNIPSECVFTSVIEKYLSRIPKSIQLLFSVHSYAWILEKPKFNNNNNFSLWDQQKFNKASCVSRLVWLQKNTIGSVFFTTEQLSKSIFF